MSIPIDLASGSNKLVTLQFSCPDGSVLQDDFEIRIEDVEPKAGESFYFEICNGDEAGDFIWGCFLNHPPPEDDSFVELRITGPNAASPGIVIVPVTGGFCAGPISNPPPDTWMWGGDTYELYFTWTCVDGTSVQADNTVPEGMQAGFPLLVRVISGNPGGRKIKIVRPRPPQEQNE